MNTYQEFVFLRTYARFLWSEGRREQWPEPVDRYIDFIFRDSRIPNKVKRLCREKMVNLEVMPSMRALWTAGKAAAQSNAVMYNCSFLTVDRLASFGEALYLLMCGTGVGFSVERQFVSQLPKVKRQHRHNPLRHCIEDSRDGWKEALDLGLQTWFDGRDIYFDYSNLRGMGAPLKTMGGRSSGPDVLRQLLIYTREVIMGAQGRQLTSLECHDIMCEIASIVVVGGTRRSALISISDLDDELLRAAKVGEFHARRFGANNSAAYHAHPDILTFMDEWVSLARSGSGERGIANLWAARINAPKRRKGKLIAGLNPCGEVALRDREFCNLTEVVIRPSDDFETLRDKITSAVWLGVIQATFIDFPYLSPEWERNCAEERLLGVSLTGQYDNLDLLTNEVLDLCRKYAIKVAREASKVLEIPVPAAVTCVKPSGTVSKLVDCSAGLHPRWSRYYRQNTQIAKSDPLFALVADQGVPWRDTPGAPHTAILSFPIESPPDAVTRHDVSALEQLEHYKRITQHWCEHNASCTVYVDHHEWLQVADWVFDNFHIINGLSFFPKKSGSYKWTPHEEITKSEFERLRSEFPEVDFSRLPEYESADETEGAREFACAAGGCEL